MQLKFNKKDMEHIVAKADKEILLAGDQGVYFLADTHNHKTAPAICYAEGCHPDKDDDWWELKGATFGADDGGEHFPKEDVAQYVRDCKKYILVKFTATSITIKGDGKEPRRTKVVDAYDTIKKKTILLKLTVWKSYCKAHPRSTRYTVSNERLEYLA